MIKLDIIRYFEWLSKYVTEDINMQEKIWTETSITDCSDVEYLRKFVEEIRGETE